jgi:SAM-dependent methyltransferase
VRLRLADSIFDLVITQEVFEHIPSIDKALGEICRILSPGGWSINTHPFALNSYSSVIKAHEEDGHLKIIGEPEYHGNPISGLGSLVYEIPGWDFLDRAVKCGFSDVKIWFIVNPELGIVGDDASGILVSSFRK